ncbi:hypothetical protein ICV00_04800 [Polynucleobacter asymbioticus]|nr:hypothetical protein ICV00_04800 [Polynucleobacter asymbioticus]
MMIKKNQFIFSYLLISLIIIATYSFIPYLSNGFWWDDAINSQTFDLLMRTNVSLWDFTNHIVKIWLVEKGRFMFNFYYSFPLFYFLSDLNTLRVGQCLAAVINIIIYGLILNRFQINKYHILLWAFFIVISFQITGVTLDPLAGFAFHYQILLFQLSILIILFQKFLISKNFILLNIVFFLWLFFMFSYEINVVFIPISLALYFFQYKFDDIKVYLVIFLFFIIYILLNIAIRANANHIYSGVDLAVSSKSIFSYFKQLSGTFPFSNIVFNDKLNFDLIEYHYYNIIFFILIIFFLNYCTRFNNRLSTGYYKALILSSCMFFLPAILPAISSRYQNEVYYGSSTLPVYYQIFGLSFFIMIIVVKFLRNRFLLFIFSILVSLLSIININNNFDMVYKIDKSMRIPRDEFSDFSLKEKNKLDKINDGDIVIKSSSVPIYVGVNIFFANTGKRIYMPNDPTAVFDEKINENPSVYYLNYSENKFSIKKNNYFLDFHSGWSTPENGYIWAISQEPVINFINYRKTEKTINFKFSISALHSQYITIYLNDSKISDFSYDPIFGLKNIDIPARVKLGDNSLKFITNFPPTAPNNFDLRKLTFSLVDFKLVD